MRELLNMRSWLQISRLLVISCAIVVIFNALGCCGSKAGEDPHSDWFSGYFDFLPRLALPQATEHSIVRLRNDGHPFILYGSPNDRSFVRARLFPPIANVHRLGRCTNRWCLVRLDGVTGWLDENRLVEDLAASAPIKTGNQAESVTIPLPVRNTLARSERSRSTPNEPFAATHLSGQLENARIEQKRYALTGLGVQLFLSVHADRTQSSRVVGSIPFFATNVNILGDCVKGWCPVRYGSVRGWIRDRHLTDEIFILEPRLQLEPVMPVDALDIYTAPGKDSEIIASISSPVTNIIPLQSCNQQWCNIRYSDLVGWVEPTYLTRQR